MLRRHVDIWNRLGVDHECDRHTDRQTFTIRRAATKSKANTVHRPGRSLLQELPRSQDGDVMNIHFRKMFSVILAFEPVVFSQCHQRHAGLLFWSVSLKYLHSCRIWTISSATAEMALSVVVTCSRSFWVTGVSRPTNRKPWLKLTYVISHTVFQLPRSSGQIIAFDKAVPLVNELVLGMTSANIALNYILLKLHTLD